MGKRAGRSVESRTIKRMTPARTRWIGVVFALLVILVSCIGRYWLTEDPALLLSRAQGAYRAREFDAAEADLRQLARLRAPTPMDHMARALVAREQGKDALSDLALIPGDHELSSQAHLLAGQIELERGRLLAAESHFQQALTRDPSNVHAHRELAYIYNIQNRRPELDEQMEALSERNAAGFELLLHWAKTRNGKWNSARDCGALARYLAADPDDRDTRLALVDGLHNLGQVEQAAAVLEFLPDTDDEARARRALLALEAGDVERADRLLSGGPSGHPSLAKVRGLLALNRGNPRGAVAHLRIAFAARPYDLGVVSALGRALRLVGDEAGARPFLDTERRHTDLTPLIAQADTPTGPTDPKLPARLGAACEAARRFAEARGWYRLAIARDPLDADAQQALFRLSLRDAALARTGAVQRRRP